jgi:hypothetical protein
MPSTERTEQKSQASSGVQTEQNRTLFQEPRIREWWKVERKASVIRIGT